MTAMHSGGLAFLFAAVALGVAVVALVREPARPPRATPRTDRVAELEAEVRRLGAELARLRAGPARGDPARGGPAPGPRVGTGGGEGEPGAAESRPDAEGADDPALARIVDEAVDRKTKKVLDELRVKANKKPPIGMLVEALELTREQREAAERVVAEGQRELHRILGVPASDGGVPLDELVEIMARGIAEPGKDHGFGRWFARIASEKIPGTNETYVARVEAVKRTMRETFKRNWSAAQYREFEEWGVDPTEIQGVPGSPNPALLERVAARARELGADPPDDG